MNASATASTAPSFRQMMGRFTTGVAVVLCDGRHGPLGATVNSLTSLSLEPPLLLFCADNASRTAAGVIAQGKFSVNILTAAQQDVSGYFAGKGEGWDIARCGRHGDWLTIPDCNGALLCEVADIYPGGDHRIIVGRVRQILAPPSAMGPLLYHEGRYSRLAADCPVA